jgi:hypothetical protein
LTADRPVWRYNRGVSPVQPQPAAPRQDPIIVRVIEQPVHETSLSDVILGSLGLVGVLLIAALVFGLLLGGLLIAYKRLRAKDGIDADGDSETLRVTPRTAD